MYIKSLEIFGFKSFAEKLHLKFSPGFTAIVGPNGSGKSNVVDAVKWVLGEQSPKNLRGMKMQDIIFSGLHSRKPLSVAEVSLNIDNSTRILPFNNDEVIISRRVYRSGENEYFINKNQTRLKTISDLFLDTGLGKEGYSIIGQGRVSEILSINPADRRQVFDQAAGIGKYKVRKDEAEDKLQRTKENLIRLEDIIIEIEKQFEQLKIQRIDACAYLELKSEWKKLSINKYLILHNKNNEKLTNLKEKMISLTNEYEAETIKHSKADVTYHKLKDDLQEVLEKVEQTKDEKAQLSFSMDKLKGEIEQIIDKQNRNKEEISALEKKIFSINALTKEKEDELKEVEVVILEKKGQIEKYSGKTSEIEKDLGSIIDNANMESKNVEIIKQKIVYISREIVKAETDQIKSEASLENLNKEKLYLEEAKVKFEKMLEKTEDDIKLLQDEYIELNAALSLINAEIDALNQQQYSQTKDLAVLDKRVNSSKQELESTKTKLEMHQNLLQSFEGFSFGVKNILKRRKSENIAELEICEVVADLIEIDSAYKLAVEVCLGNSLQHIVTKNEEDAKVLIDFLRNNKFGRATFLPLSSIRPKILNNYERESLNFRGTVGIVSELVVFEEKYRNIIENLLGRTLLAETMDQAILIARKFNHSFRIVTLDADILNSGGSMTGGENTSKSFGLLGRRNEIQNLRNECENLKLRLITEVKDLDEIKNALAEIQKNLKSNLDKLNKEQLKSALLNQKIKNLVSDKAKATQEFEVNKVKLQECSFGITELNDNLDIIRKRIFSLTEEKKSLVHTEESFESKLTSSSSEKEALRIELNKLKEIVARYQIEMSKWQERQKYLSLDIVREEEELQKVKIKLLHCKELNLDLQSQCAVKKTEYADLANTLSCYSLQYENFRTEKQLLSENIDLKEKEIEHQRKNISELKDAQYKLDLRLTKLESEIDYLERNLWNEFEISHGKAREYLDSSLDFQLLDSSIMDIKKQLSEMGEVNLSSIDEYFKVEERFKSLTFQREDLIEAKKNLEIIVEELTETINREFCEEFNIINENFKEVFTKLFGGGKAELLLADENRPLDCGIEIVAQPPGKRLQSLSLLSGGEKALTAAAILFAIFKRRPALFCLLDEIDAVLDESNISNLGNFLREFSSKTQFLVITHRKATMEMCDTLLGISMEEKGVSKLVSVKMDEIAI